MAVIARLADDSVSRTLAANVQRFSTLPAEGRSRDAGQGLEPPTVWVLADEKLGHTTQSVGLAEALGWPYATKELRFNALNRLSNRLLGAGLLTLDRRHSTPLLPPWPDLVIATGRKTAPVARWIGAQSHGRARLVQLGRKGADRADDFDLSVTCSHFAMPPHPRRIETRAPLTAINDRKLHAAGERWRHLFGSEPRPHVALIVGGTSALHRLDAETATHMGREVAGFAQAAGGSLFIVTSPRTGATAGAALRAGIQGVGRFYEWQSRDADNPYLGCLAVADTLVVTGDSESMLAEAAATNKPLYIYPLPNCGNGLRQRLRGWVSGRAGPRQGSPTARPRLQSLCARLIELGLVRAPRDLSAMHRCLIEGGHAHPFGAPLSTQPRTPLRELDQVADRVRAMLGYSPLETAG